MEEVLLFSKPLSTTDIRKRLSIPVRILPNLPPFIDGRHMTDLQVEDEGGKIWSMRCIVRKKGKKKPVLSRGWTKFVQKNDLITGDRVTFVKKQGTLLANYYKIRVKKPVKVFGKILGYAPSNHVVHTH
ncbi:hypothetical protein HS088_TW18G00507 [Tripterygium wilfordii]|uniref:TF-B3 domain-containing protein n=1 Tax=Tripterygium wilfordii TaxID=458696 RepID=A0A7J7CCJ4_TRIWF|nr:hypothetical protein HS088_TW18G00507 [Tripterygium wilfordii]